MATKKPIGDRRLLAASLYAGMLLLSQGALAQTPGGASPSSPAPMTEHDSVRLGLARPDIATLIEATVASARSDVAEAGRWANPTLDIGRESIKSPLGQNTERTIELSQQFDVGGKRGLRRDAARERLAAVVADTEQRRVEIAAEIRQRFYEALYRQKLAAATGDWERRMSAIAETVKKLHQGGEVAGYDRRRMALERMTAQTRSRVEQAEYQKALLRLAALTGDPASPAEPAGDLIPPEPQALELLLARIDQRPALRAHERRAGASELDRQAARRAWIPDVTIGLGQKSAENGGARDSGTVLSVSVPLPFFDRGQTGQQRAAAQADISRSEARLLRTRLDGDARALWQQLKQLNAAARDYREQSTTGSRELVRIAEAAYQGGESSILELLDAYKAALEVEQRALELGWNARRAAIELDTIAGNGKL
ncbi:TolC family protein [Massilia glaciei]|uniref:TolC family protein n=1 Tax=Massilia glaciei TaxID=1524097 RepID=UPI0015E81C69|nr:TolC family protein [Massilia glaciei]